MVPKWCPDVKNKVVKRKTAIITRYKKSLCSQGFSQITYKKICGNTGRFWLFHDPRNAVDRKVSRVRIPNSPPQKPVNKPVYRLFYFCPKDKPARSSVFRGENQLFSPALIELQRLLKSPPSGRASPVSIACAEVILDL